MKQARATKDLATSQGWKARLVRNLMRQGWRRGIQGGKGGWTVVGGMAAISYLAGRAMKREEDVVFSEKLEPGQSLRITHEAKS